jgi:hypothetical protein
VARTGRCLCGEVTYEIAGDLIATAVCHCDHCQRQGGGAFSVNLVVHESQLAVAGSLQSCGSPIVSELVQTSGVVAVKAGTLDDKADVRPTVEVWCTDRQPWVTLPDMAVSLERE